jgi:DNA polymerase III epsilon subunit-like protein
VCRALDIPLKHHDAASDAAACAQILVQAMATGWRPGTLLKR